MYEVYMKKVGLVLSGGSAYGFAHIGVLDVLIKNNIPIDIITGTSMGALVGGFFATGMKVEEMQAILTKFSRRQIIDFNPFVLTDTGLLFGKKVTHFLKKIVGDKKIEDCQKKYCAIATDLCNGKKVVFENGSLVEAIRASTSVPGIFKPVKRGKQCLVDGGASDNLPVSDARRLGAELVIAVDVCSFYKKQNNLKTAYDIVISASNLLVSALVQQTKDKGDIYIKIDQPKVSFDKFTSSDVKYSILAGRRYAKAFLPQIKKALGIKDKQSKSVSK